MRCKSCSSPPETLSNPLPRPARYSRVAFPQNNGREFWRRKRALVPDQLAQRLWREKLGNAVGRFRKSVGVKVQNVALLQGDAPTLVPDHPREPQRKARTLNLSAAPILI